MDRNNVGDLRDAFDQGFGPEPAHRPVSDRLEAGHRAVRRRRAVGTLLTVAVATVVGVGAVAALGDGPGGTAQVAADPRPTAPTTSPTPTPVPDDSTHYAKDGTLVIDPGATVLARIDNPLHKQPPDQSVALDLRHDDGEVWLLLTYEHQAAGNYGSMGSIESPSAAFADFSDWVDVQVQAWGDGTSDGAAAPIPKNPVRFGQGATLVPVDGIRIVLQRPHPDLPDSFAPPGARTAVALVEGPDGKRQWVLARDIGGLDVVKFPASRGADVEAFLTFARQQYADGAGLR